MSGNINVGAGLVPALKFKFLTTRATIWATIWSNYWGAPTVVFLRK